MKISEVIDAILKYHPDLGKDYNGCDNYKSGDSSVECTGIVTALTPNIAVIRKAIELNANLIVTHEPTFYTSADGPGWFEDFPNTVYEDKKELLDRYGIVVWRDHDHMHAHDPDCIFTGVLKYLGWLDRAETDRDTGSFAHFLVETEPMKLKDLCGLLIDRIGLNGAKYIGDPENMVSRIALVGHLFPEPYKRKDGTPGEYSVQVIKTLEEWADVIIPGEIIDWTVLSYIRDAKELGRNKSMISIGHFNWEELGMRYMQEWLQELIGKELKVTYVPSGDMYQYISKEGETRCS